MGWQAPKCAADLEAVLFPCKTMSYDEKRGSPELVTKGWEAVQRIQQKALEESLSKSLQAELELNAAKPALPARGPKALPEEDADAPFGAALGPSHDLTRVTEVSCARGCRGVHPPVVRVGSRATPRSVSDSFPVVPFATCQSSRCRGPGVFSMHSSICE